MTTLASKIPSTEKHGSLMSHLDSFPSYPHVAEGVTLTRQRMCLSQRGMFRIMRPVHSANKFLCLACRAILKPQFFCLKAGIFVLRYSSRERILTKFAFQEELLDKYWTTIGQLLDNLLDCLLYTSDAADE